MLIICSQIPITNNLNQSDNSDDKSSIIFTKSLEVLILFDKGALGRAASLIFIRHINTWDRDT